MGEKDVGIIVGFEDCGNNAYIMDGLVRKTEEGYRYLKADKYREDGTPMYFEQEVDFRKDVEGLVLGQEEVELMVTTSVYNTGEEYQALYEESMRIECMARVMYVPKEIVHDHMFVRLMVEEVKDSVEGSTVYRITVLRLNKNNVEWNNTREEHDELFDSQYEVIVEEAIKLSRAGVERQVRNGGYQLTLDV